MSDPIITRALLERYLRATGWLDGDDGWHTMTTTRKRLIRPPSPGTTDERWLDYAIDQLSSHIVAYHYSIACRLGLCAAADLLRTSAESARANRCPENDATADQLDLEIEALLLWAGVDPKRWEESRHA